MITWAYRGCAALGMAGTVTSLLGMLRPWLLAPGIAALVVSYLAAARVAERDHQKATNRKVNR